ncbi:MAG: hypothetical protein SVU32_06320 [Candidatus Nanohaloarchaea archaeon]|nr:hypothetical protein [Candidatus Nanohaloarchaea archaeon]
MLRADYTQSWNREYRGKQYTTIHQELERLSGLIDRHELERDLFEIKALDQNGSLQRYQEPETVTALDEEQIYAVAAEYSDEEHGIRLEFDRNPAVHDEFTLYVEGDDLFRDEVTAAMDVAATPTFSRTVSNLIEQYLA